jgi:hypothetical protein
MKTFEVQVTATITKWLRVEAEDEDEATDLAYEGFDCQPSVTEKYWQEVDFVREVSKLGDEIELPHELTKGKK